VLSVTLKDAATTETMRSWMCAVSVTLRRLVHAMITFHGETAPTTMFSVNVSTTLEKTLVQRKENAQAVAVMRRIDAISDATTTTTMATPPRNAT